MKKPININGLITSKEYRENTSDKKKDIELLISQNEKMKKENHDLKKKVYKTNINTYTNQIKYNKDAYIALLEKQKDFLISILVNLINTLNIKNKINRDIIIFHLEKNIGKEKEKEKFINDIKNLMEDNKNGNANINFNIKNNKTPNLRYNNIDSNYIKNISFNKTNFNFQILSIKNNKTSYKNNKINNSYNNGNDKTRDKKEVELLKKINEMLGIIKKKKDILKYKKNNLSFRVSKIKEEK